MVFSDKIWVGGESKMSLIEPSKACCHGFIAGDNNTGKHNTLRVLAESFSDMGVPVFLADVKGDMSGICAVGQSNENMEERIAKFGIENFEYKAYPTTFYDVFGQMGIPMRTNISELGPILLGRMLGLSDVQRAVMSMVFRIADDQNLMLLDLKDLRLLLTYVGDHADEYKLTYGNISTATIGAIQRNLALLSDEGADAFFGEPAFNIMDFFTPASDGRGMINVLNATELFNKPLLYSTFLLWLMSELNENLPDIIYFEKPKMVFFFDEAQLLFSGLSSELNRRIEMMLRKLKDKGIGVYFLVDTPCTFPDNIQSHLQNRIIHAIHAYTPAEIKKATTAVQYLRPNPALTSKDILSQLTDDEAIVSFLDRNGVPSMAERVFILPPQSFIGPAGSEKIQELTNANPLYEKYRDDFDPESAYEILLAKYASNGFNSTYNAQERRAEERERKEELRLQKEQERLEEQDRRIIEMENKLFYRELRDSSRQEDRERLIEEKERAAEIREQRERERQNDRERREAERQARAEERARREAERQRLQLERSLERYQDFNGDPAQRFKSREIGDSLVRGSFDNKKNT